MAVTGEPDGGPERVLPALQIALCGIELALGSKFRDADAVLLGLQEVERDRVRVEGLQEFAALLGELGERPREDHPALRGLCLPLDDLGLQLLGESLDPGARELDLPVEVLHERLGVTGQDVGLAAPGPRGPSLSEAEEVQVLVLGEGERQAPSALPAVQQALQVMLMASLANPGDVARAKRLLDPVEQALGDERLVLAGVADAVPLHHGSR